LREDKTPPEHQYFVSKDPFHFKSVGETFLGRSIPNVTEVNLSPVLLTV